MIFGEINGAITLLGRIGGMLANTLKRWRARPVTSVARRFVDLFEAHGVHRNQIPRVLGHGLAISDLVDEASLLPKLTEPVLGAACSLFGVRREWLDGVGEEAYIRREFYKSPADFQRFIEELKATRPIAELTGYLVVPQKATSHDQAYLVLAEAIASSGDATIYRYHVCGTWIYDYWKSRAYLTACIAIAWKNKVYVIGKYAGRSDLSILAASGNLPGPVIERLASGGRRWYAEELALRPELYLQGVNPETSGFGVTSALQLWLDLDNEGWMDIGIQKTARTVFEAKLASYIVTE